MAGSALAQTAAANPVIRQGTYTVRVPTGARTLVMSRGNAALSLTGLPAKLKQVIIKFDVSAAKYSDTLVTAYSSTTGKTSSTLTTRFVGPFDVLPVRGGQINPALNAWTVLWSSIQPGTSSFTFTLNGKAMTGREAAQPFKVRMLFSKRTAAQLKKQTALRPPRNP
ncbi:hypothetical protein [Deinococcus rubellus]|uniref:Copper chaperone PCu(A)C n=1 Tax=Deinococcus rubellus TaxID=1889240 RepID=A0ABY5YLP6_9DEIO|nr:hypothetical protein [Deinococcus rubellus]UWX65272.1 hypothetical protein N0D28_06350 [Deinococcus rubellus]